jgi:hypothetical protein
VTVEGLEGIGCRQRLHYGRQPSRIHVGVDSRVTVLATAALLGGAGGAALSKSPLLAAVLVGSVFLAAVVAWFDVLGVAVVLTAALPWLVVTSEALPRLVVTFVAGATAGAILLVAAPKSRGTHASVLLRLGMVLFFAPTVISLGREGLGADAIQAAKYVVFPAMVWVVAEATNTRHVGYLRTVAFWSSVAALTVNLLLGAAGVAKTTYYGSGEILGLGSEHGLALLAGCVTAASLASSISLAWGPVIAVGAIATVATGVRSTLPGLALAAVVRMVSGRVRFRIIALVALAVAGIFASGAAGVVESRFHKGEKVGEFQSFANFGSGRGGIYQAAISAWWQSSPIEWIVGTGLRTIPRIAQQRLGGAFVGHSDVVEVGVQIGIAGLIGLILMWWVLFARAQSRLPLLVLASFAVFNGILEYSGPLVIGLMLATGALSFREHTEASARTEPLIPRSTASAVAVRSRRSQ